MSGYTVVFPVKPWRLGKSRLALDDISRQDLARAFALDVLDVLTSVDAIEHVLVVSDEGELRVEANRIGATVLNDRPLVSNDPLNDAIRAGARWAAMRRPDAPVVVVPSDLPALTAPTLAAVLADASAFDRAFVPDAWTRGTTLLTARDPVRLEPAFGAHSAPRHAAAGYHELADADPRVRTDVDTVAQLRDARHLGLGDRSFAVVDRLLAQRASGTGRPASAPALHR